MQNAINLTDKIILLHFTNKQKVAYLLDKITEPSGGYKVKNEDQKLIKLSQNLLENVLYLIFFPHSLSPKKSTLQKFLHHYT